MTNPEPTAITLKLSYEETLNRLVLADGEAYFFELGLCWHEPTPERPRAIYRESDNMKFTCTDYSSMYGGEGQRPTHHLTMTDYVPRQYELDDTYYHIITDRVSGDKWIYRSSLKANNFAMEHERLTGHQTVKDSWRMYD